MFLKMEARENLILAEIILAYAWYHQAEVWSADVDMSYIFSISLLIFPAPSWIQHLNPTTTIKILCNGKIHNMEKKETRMHNEIRFLHLCKNHNVNSGDLSFAPFR